MEKQQRCERCSCLPPRDPCGSPPASQRVQPRGVCCSPTSSSPHNSSPLPPAQNRGKPRWNPAAGLCYGVCTTAQGASSREVHRGPQLQGLLPPMKEGLILTCPISCLPTGRLTLLPAYPVSPFHPLPHRSHAWL